VGTDLNLARQRAGIDLQSRLSGMTAKARLDAFASTNEQLTRAGYPPLTLSEMGLTSAGELGPGGGGTPTLDNRATSAQTAPAQPGAAMPVQPGAAAQPAGARPDAVTLKAKEIGREALVKSAAEVVADQSNTIKLLNDADRNIKLLDSGRTNFGTIISGQIPGERFAGDVLKTKDAVNTKNILEYVNFISAKNAKMLGTNPTDRDLMFVTSTKPDATWSEADVKEWIQRSDRGQRRTMDIARKQIETGGTYEAPLPADGSDNKAEPGTAANPIKLKL